MYLFRPSDLAQSESIDFLFQPNHKTEIPPPQFNQLKRTKAKISDADLNQDKSNLLSESSVLSRNIVYLFHSLYFAQFIIKLIKISLDSIPSASVKIQIIGGKVYLSK